MPRPSSLLPIVLVPLAVLTGVIACGRDQVAKRAASGHQTGARIDVAPTQGAGLPPVRGPADTARPLVLIDAGHGGHDPGARAGQDAGQDLAEKDLTLALARVLEARLLAGGGIRVAMTRADDRYLLLEQRWGLARRLNADLFVSIHADSSADAAASGATIYTLSERGSSVAAQQLAASENRVDAVNGVRLADTSQAVSAILVDLAQRRTAAQSDEFARLLLREGHGRMLFRGQAQQSAAFVVLKAPDVPSVLFEAGYLSNPRDRGWLTSPAGKQAFGDVADRAIRAFFARQAGSRG